MNNKPLTKESSFIPNGNDVMGLIMTLEERMDILKQMAANDKVKDMERKNDSQIRTEEALRKVEELTPRIEALITIANKCIQEGIEFPSPAEITKGCDYYIDDVETKITKPYDFECLLSEKFKDMSIERLWEVACSGNMETLKEYYEKGEGILNIRYEKFRTYHSLIMGAFRIASLKQWNIC